MTTLKRVVVTGLGAVTPIGNTVSEFWDGLLAGKSGAGPITRFDASGFKTQFACEVKGYDPLSVMDVKEVRAMDLYSQYAVSAAAEAVTDSSLNKSTFDPFRVGVIFATGIGGLISLQEDLLRYAKDTARPRFSPHMITKMIPNMAAGIIAMRYGFCGATYAVSSACASASHAMVDAMSLIRLGKVDAVIVGGAEAAINITSLGGFGSMRALSERNDSPQTASRPFDESRDGFVLGEGAGALVLESLDFAKSRDAHIYAEMVGGGMTADAYHFTLPHPEGRSVHQAMVMALDEAQITPDEVDYINLHATSTPAGDLPELRAVNRLFGKNLDTLHVSATKSMTGHLLGGAGAIEAVASLMAMKHSIIPPTINTQKLDPGIDFPINVTLHTPVKKTINVALSNTFGFGGQNATVAFKKID